MPAGHALLVATSSAGCIGPLGSVSVPASDKATPVMCSVSGSRSNWALSMLLLCYSFHSWVGAWEHIRTEDTGPRPCRVTARGLGSCFHMPSRAPDLYRTQSSAILLSYRGLRAACSASRGSSELATTGAGMLDYQPLGFHIDGADFTQFVLEAHANAAVEGD